MSADTTIAIIVTKGGNGEKEYRVRCIGNQEEITYQYDEEKHGQMNEEFLLEMFGDCEVIHDKKSARKKAEEIEKEFGEVEYGICTFEFPDQHFPSKQHQQ